MSSYNSFSSVSALVWLRVTAASLVSQATPSILVLYSILWYNYSAVFVLEHMAAVSLSIYSKVSERAIKLKWHRNAW